MYITRVPNTKAIPTDMKMAVIIPQSLTGVYVIAKIGTRVSPCLNHGKSKRSTKQFKHHQNRGEVGIPKELNMSSSTMSVTITARKIVITSRKENKSG